MDSLRKTGTYEIMRLFPNAKGRCSFNCIYCGRSRVITVPKEYMNKTCSIKCYCERSIPVLFVGRSYYRKEVSLPGELRDADGHKRVITIKNISQNGLGIDLGISKYNIKAGDVVRVRFRLDNSAFTWVDISVIIRRIESSYAGCEFQYLNEGDKKTIGFYLLR